ncbi:MAG: hypothetical protein JW797_19510 [Bradymonadales bacterium]|nr:hypothetical protein [Bradymonadales bacterium]
MHRAMSGNQQCGLGVRAGGGRWGVMTFVALFGVIFGSGIVRAAEPPGGEVAGEGEVAGMAALEGSEGQAVSGEGSSGWLRGVWELGFLGVLDHRVQFSKDGTYFDYDDEGGQDVLFFVQRLSLELRVARRHEVILLYQPLELVTTALLERNVRVDGLVFPEGTPMSLRYSFPFYRASYLYHVLDEPRAQVSVGGSMQIRNAAIEFQSLDGELYRSNGGIGPVPLLKVRGRYQVADRIWLGTEIDGIYAPVSYLNGSDNEVEGALLDASIRAGLRLSESADAFVNLRYLGGGATGTSDPDGPGDGYTRNWLHFLTLTVGLSHSLF